jgi:aryl-alcohol dehydrogenase-like predicted oxidoreductase
MRDPGTTAIGTWSGGRFLHFGQTIDAERLVNLLQPNGIDTVLTADAYGQGEADELLGKALDGVPRADYSLIGAVGHDFYKGERDGPRGFPRFTDPALREAADYAGYLRMATERSLERIGVDAFDLLLLHNPDRTGYRSEEVWAGMERLRSDGLTRLCGVAPGPANGFTLDLIGCFERYGELIDWAMIILNPLEPWPGELCLEAARKYDVKLITRVADYGGLFWDDLREDTPLEEGDHRAYRPEGWIAAGAEKLERLRPIAERNDLTPMQLACQWNLAHDPVHCVVPTLIQEAGADARTIEDKRDELATLPMEAVMTDEEVGAIRQTGDNVGCMALKGASPDHHDDEAERPDRWPLDAESAAIAKRWSIDPERDLRGPSPRASA